MKFATLLTVVLEELSFKLEMCPQYTDAPTPTHCPAQGHWYHKFKGLDVGKCHTKFQLSSPEGIKVISCKRNANVPYLHLNLQVNLNLVTNVTSWRNAICPTPAKGRQGHTIFFFFLNLMLPWQPNKIVTGHKTHKLVRQSSNDYNCQIWLTSLHRLWRKCNLTIFSL